MRVVRRSLRAHGSVRAIKQYPCGQRGKDLLRAVLRREPQRRVRERTRSMVLRYHVTFCIHFFLGVKKNRRVAQAKIRTKFGSFRGTRRAELAQIVTVTAEMPIRRLFFWFSRNREKAKKYSSSLVFPPMSAPNVSVPAIPPLASKKVFPVPYEKARGIPPRGTLTSPKSLTRCSGATTTTMSVPCECARFPIRPRRTDSPGVAAFPPPSRGMLPPRETHPRSPCARPADPPPHPLPETQPAARRRGGR